MPLNEWLENKFSLSADEKKLIIGAVNKRFMGNFNVRWKSTSRTRKIFDRKYGDWQDRVFEVLLQTANSTCKKEGGRPLKPFEECSSRTKRHKIKRLRESHPQELIDAASSNLHTRDDINIGFDADTALALIVQTKLSKFQYEVIRKSCKDIGHNIFPSYNKILERKIRCYPPNISVTETSAHVPLQDLLDHTARRILQGR